LVPISRTIYFVEIYFGLQWAKQIIHLKKTNNKMKFDQMKNVVFSDSVQ